MSSARRSIKASAGASSSSRSTAKSASGRAMMPASALAARLSHMKIETPPQADADLVAAVRANDLPRIYASMWNGASPNATVHDPQSGQHVSLIHLACQHGHVQATDVLLAYGARAQLGNALGVTPLHWAAGSGNPQLVQLLLHTLQEKDGPGMSASMRKATRYGSTPMHYAAAAAGAAFETPAHPAAAARGSGGAVAAARVTAQRRVQSLETMWLLADAAFPATAANKAGARPSSLLGSSATLRQAMVGIEATQKRQAAEAARAAAAQLQAERASRKAKASAAKRAAAAASAAPRQLSAKTDPPAAAKKAAGATTKSVAEKSTASSATPPSAAAKRKGTKRAAAPEAAIEVHTARPVAAVSSPKSGSAATLTAPAPSMTVPIGSAEAPLGVTKALTKSIELPRLPTLSTGRLDEPAPPIPMPSTGKLNKLRLRAVQTIKA
ncbi:hypothetical protein CXG81DRAFT_20995 [Caulochytrium protostelioides]|uniref:Uncharacterized protein n=1 Tax=Caulochytrium protostelioides TaxID=1555241 RepID=A0A4P9X1M1_9FUNG|nr:hypothetical protein CXG81DRAFT_20995 [Caulochytrium protostelioides]|eukprot:RKO98843.1 hypothetical protein CXG81DRAFT_20995 [Caulochytrium protostelioides]